MVTTEKKLKGDATLGFLAKDGQVWLSIKTRNIGAGRRSGYGGGMEPQDKDLTDCLERETEEEGKVEISREGLEKVGIIDFHNEASDGEVFITKVHIFLIRNWQGEPQETAEMKDPILFEEKNLPFEDMMPDCKEWLPFVLEGKKIVAEFHYGPHQAELKKERKIKIVTTLPGEPASEIKMR